MSAVVPLPVASRDSESSRATLSECVGQAARRYLADIRDTENCDLYDVFLGEMERPLLREVLLWTGGNQSRAAQMLGLSRATLRKKLQQHELL